MLYLKRKDETELTKLPLVGLKIIEIVGQNEGVRRENEVEIKVNQDIAATDKIKIQAVRQFQGYSIQAIRLSLIVNNKKIEGDKSKKSIGILQQKLLFHKRWVLR